MSVIKNSGTQLTILGTEHSLATPTDPGTYMLFVDVNELADGETLELKLKRKVLVAGTIREVFHSVFVNGQAEDVIQSLALPTPHGCEATLEQNGGSVRNFDWSLETV